MKNKKTYKVVKKTYKDRKLYSYLVIEYGDKYWYQNGNLHREEDLPAIEYTDGSQQWYKEGKLHREGDLPSVYYADGTKGWYKEGKLHREGGLPAIEWNGGDKEWYYEGEKLKVNCNEEALRLIKMKAFW